jgi:dihydropyrimidinase
MTISAKTHHMNVDYSCYEGKEVQGVSETVLSRGKVVIENEQYVGRPGDGKYQKRSMIQLKYKEPASPVLARI